MSAPGFSQFVADHQAALLRQAADQRLLLVASARHRRPAGQHLLAGWHLRSPVARRPFAAPCP